MQKTVMEASSGRLEAYMAAKEKGMDTDTFIDLYRQYWDIDQSGKTASEKAHDWAHALEKAVENRTITGAQRNALKEKMSYMQIFPAETEKLDQLVGENISADDAQDITWLIRGIEGTGAYNEETGKNTVTPADKYEEIGDMSFLSESARDAVMKIYMPDYDPTDEEPNKTELKYDYARQEWGITAAEYAAIYREHAENDRKADKIAAWKELG